MLFMAFSANASDITVWQPTTAAGGAPVPPGYWDQQATYQFFGASAMQPSNITLAPSTAQISSTSLTDNSIDYSSHTTNASDGGGAQTNYNSITRENSKMDITNTTTTNN